MEESQPSEIDVAGFSKNVAEGSMTEPRPFEIDATGFPREAEAIGRDGRRR